MFLLNIRMINLSLNELKPVTQIRKINDYESKSEEDLIKTTPETPKTTPETKLKATPKQTLYLKQHQNKH